MPAPTQAAIDAARYNFVYIADDEPYYKQLASAMGIDIDRIDWSVSYCQGDGACFTGSWGYEPDSRIKIRLITDDERLWAIADGLAQYQHSFGNQLTATIYRVDHHYSHDRCVTLDLDGELFSEQEQAAWERRFVAAEKEILELMREFMRWIYAEIQAEYEYQTSDEFVAEMLEHDQ